MLNPLPLTCCTIWRMYCTEILCSRKVAMINKLSTSSRLYNRTGRWGDSQRSIVGSIISVVAQYGLFRLR
jgi:hypothetical protein